MSDEKGTEKDYSVATISERNSLQANSDDSASTQNSRRSSRGNIAKPEKVSRGGRIVKPDADDNQSVSSASSVGSSISGRSSHHSKGRKDATPKQDRDTSKPKSTVKQGNTMSLHALALSELGVESTDVDNAVNNASSLVKQDENIEYKHSASKVKESSLLFGAAGVALPERKKSFEVHSAPHSRSPTPVSQSPPRDEEVKSTPSTEKKPHPHLTVDTFQSEQQRGRSKEVVDSATKPANAAQTQNSKRNRSLTPTSLSKHGIYFGDNGSSTPSAAGGKAKSRSSTPTNLVTSASAPVLERASSATPKFSSEKGIARTPSASGSLGTSRGRSTTPRSSATTAVVPEARSARSITPNAAGRSTNTQAVSSALRSSSTSSSRSMTAPNRGKALSSSTAKSTQKSTTDKLNTLDTLASVSKKKPTDLSIRTSVNVKPTTQVRAIGNSTGNMPSSPSYRAANRSNSTASASTNGSRSNTPTGIPKPVFNKPVTSSLSRTTASTAARTTALTGQRNGTVSNNSSRAMSNTRLNIGKSEGSRVSTFARTGTAPTPLSKTSNSSSFGSARGDRSKSSSSATPAAKASLRTTATPLDKSVRSTTATPRQSEQKTKPSLKTVAKSVVNKGAPLPTKLDPSLLAVPVSPGKVYMPSLKHSSQGAISKMYQSTLIDRSPHGSPQSYAAPTFFEDVEMDSNQNGSASDILSSTQPITVDGKTYISMDEVSKITAALKEITTGSTGSKSTNCRNEKPVSSENSRSGSISSTSASEKRAGEETHITKGPKGAATVLYNNRYMKPTAASKATTADKGVSPLRPADNPFQSIL